MIDEAIRYCRMQGCAVDYLLQLISSIPRLLDKADIEYCLVDFHNRAGLLPCWQDYDVGALILESAGDEFPDYSGRDLFYRHAFFRARLFASSSSGSGEGMARMLHVNEIEKKVNSLVLVNK
jgi:hypothetical protein